MAIGLGGAAGLVAVGLVVVGLVAVGLVAGSSGADRHPPIASRIRAIAAFRNGDVQREEGAESLPLEELP